MTLLVLSPHPDDEVIGMGGTIAKYSQEGERIVVIIFTSGEASHPWQKKRAINKTREREALEAGRVTGTAKTIFFELADTKLSTEVVEQEIPTKLKKIIDDEKPRMIFMPATDDIHKDHQAVANVMLAVHDENKLDIPVWMYTVWNPWHVKNRDKPRMVVDISKTFQTKWKAIQVYKSQRISTYQLIPTVLIRGFIHGINHGMHMAEVFLQAR